MPPKISSRSKGEKQQLETTIIEEVQVKNDNEIITAMKSLLDKKFSEVNNKLDLIVDELDDLKNHLKQTEEKADKALSLAEKNIERIDTNAEHIETLKDKLKTALDTIDDLQNRSLRKTLIFKNIQKVNENENWQDVKNLLASQLASIMKITVEEAYKNIERAHRGKINVNDSQNKKKVPTIIAKFHNWEFSEQVKSTIISANRQKNSDILVSQMYSPNVTEKRNEAMKLRRELISKDGQLKAYVRFPADLMVKYPDDKNYRKYKSF